MKTSFDYFTENLDQYVEKAKASNAELAADIISRGICDRQGWLRDYLKADALGKVAQYTIDQLATTTPEKVLEELTMRFEQEIGWHITSNSDSESQIYHIQALQTIRNELQWAVKSLNEDK